MTLEELYYYLKNASRVEDLDEKREEIAKLIPMVSIMFDYDQQNHAHQYDLWFHSLHTVLGLPRKLDDDMLYLAALLHDIGKPKAQCSGKRPDDTNMHYYGHPEISEAIVAEFIEPTLLNQGYTLSSEDTKRLRYYVRYHDDHVSLRLKYLRRHLTLTDFETFRKLMLLQIADANAHILEPIIQQRVDICTQLYGEVGYNNYNRILNGE